MCRDSETEYLVSRRPSVSTVTEDYAALAARDAYKVTVMTFFRVLPGCIPGNAPVGMRPGVASAHASVPYRAGWAEKRPKRGGKMYVSGFETG
jgi:hypothetical protein